jgi:hypothetical protein
MRMPLTRPARHERQRPGLAYLFTLKPLKAAPLAFSAAGTRLVA